MRRCLILYGMTCIIGQVIALRELSVVFQGNELVYGAVLAAWLLLFALGSGLLGRLAERNRLGISAFVLALAAGGALVPITILLARSARWLIVGRSGVTPSFGSILLATFIVMAPLCLLLGFFYALACAIEMRRAESPTRVATRVYVFEAIGAFTGGVLFTYLLIQVLDGFRIGLLVAAVDCLAAFAVWRHDRRKRPWGWMFLVAFLVFSVALVSPLGTVVDFLSQTTRFPGRVLRASLDTPYGRIDVVEANGRTEFYQSGVLAGATHMDRAAEETAFLPLLAHPAPKRALIIGGCLTGVLRKALEIPWLRVDYVELDPALISVARRFADPADRAALDSPRVRVFTRMDGRLFVKRTRTLYDVIISAVPNPSTGLINRFYTVEFFSEARRALSPDGVLAVGLDGSPAYMSPPQRALAASIFLTLKYTFGSVAVLPSDNAVYYLATPARRPDFPDAGVLAARMQRWGLKPSWLTAGALREITAPERARQLLSSFFEPSVYNETYLAARDGTAARLRSSYSRTTINTDLRPVAYYHALLLWADAFQARGRWLMNWAFSMDLWSVLFIVGMVTGLLALATTFAPRPLWVGLPAVRVYSGMAGFVLEMVLIFAFQSLYGYAYSQIGVIFAAFMVGIAIGAVITGRLDIAPSEIRVLMLLQCALAVLAAAIVPILVLLAKLGPSVGQMGAMVGILLLNLCIGAVIGAEYPISVAAGASGRERLGRPAGLAAGLYAMDLAGACLGALLGGCVLIPVLGIPRTCWAMSVMSVAALPLLLLSERRRFQRPGASGI